MDIELENWLKAVWNDRHPIMRLAPSYKWKGQKHTAVDRNNSSVQFIVDLIKRTKGKAFDAQRADVVEFIDEVFYNAAVWQCRIDFAGGDAYEENVNMATIRGIGWDEVQSRRFILYYTRSQRPYRIFVNLKDAYRTVALKRMCYFLFSSGTFQQVSVAAPGMDRADAMVIYMDNQYDVDTALDALRNFARGHRQYFGTRVPALSKRVDGMQGFATSMTPPDIQITRTKYGLQKSRRNNQDFLIYRAQLIFMALEKSTVRHYDVFSSKHYRSFKARVEDLFAKAGIDVNNPSEQKETQKVYEPWQIEHREKLAAYDAQATLAKNLGTLGMEKRQKIHPSLPGGRRKRGLYERSQP